MAGLKVEFRCARRAGVQGRCRHGKRRGAVAAQVAICSVFLLGMAALSIDVGHLYRTQAEMQKAADAGAHAAVQDLASFRGEASLVAARATAQNYVNSNPVLGESVTLGENDVAFGRAYIDDTGRYVLNEGDPLPNAITVRVRRTADSENGPVPLFFARALGFATKNMTAEATAILTPRDIVFVLDLSASHNDDSSLRSYKIVEIGNRAVWENLWDESLAPQPVEGGLPAGPKFGNMRTWGTEVTGPGWDFAGDPGLLRLPKGNNWSLSSATASQTLSERGYGTYTSSEMSVINSASRDSDVTQYRRRVLVALGIYRWKSGKSGGQPGGNGDNVIDSSELQIMVPYPSEPSNPSTCCKKVGGSWDGYVDYVRSSSSNMCRYEPTNYMFGDPGLQYRFGLKTWVDYLQEKQVGDSASPGMGGVPTQPMGAVADATREMLNILDDLDSNDLVGMASYGRIGYGPAEKPNHMSWLTADLASVRSRIDMLQAGMWSNTTNIAQGIDKGVEVLFHSAAARPNASKFMVLLTDGNPNERRDLSATCGEYEVASVCREDAKQAARDARRRGVVIYTVSVGSNAAVDLMDEIATIGGGSHFHAEGSIATYRQQMLDIFRALGTMRPVVLIR